MGLPLYKAPVESDVRSRPAPKSPAHSRSAIRRVHRRNEGTEWAEARSRVLAHELGRLTRESASAAADESSPPPLTVTQLWTGSGPVSYTSPELTSLMQYRTSGSGRGSGGAAHRASQEPAAARRTGGLDDRSLAVMSERWANLHTRANLDLLPDRDEPLPRLSASGPDSDRSRHPARRAHPDSHRFFLNRGLTPHSARRSRQESGSSARYMRRGGFLNPALSSRSPPPPPPPELGSMDRPTSGLGSRETTRASPTPPHYVPSVTTASAAAQSARLDGLGDRTRSLSPEDGVWDTLLTTLTPDPQPPSVGSSFASASASMSGLTTSQSAATTSSANTSMTGRDAVVDGSMSDANCESACEGSETEGDEDEDEECEEDARNALARFHRRSSRGQGRRSYADVAGRTGSNSSGAEDPLEFLGDMQRIVRHFARREDIPDEWWAEVGLSRTLSRASN